jgi:hypothetical protein
MEVSKALFYSYNSLSITAIRIDLDPDARERVYGRRAVLVAVSFLWLLKLLLIFHYSTLKSKFFFLKRTNRWLHPLCIRYTTLRDTDGFIGALAVGLLSKFKWFGLNNEI